MTNTKLLEALISSGSITKKDIANRLNISVDTLQKKIDGLDEFNASEITTLEKVLRMDQSECDEAFFSSQDESSNDMSYASTEIMEALEMTDGLVKLIDILNLEFVCGSARDLSEAEKYRELSSLLPTIKASVQGILAKIDIVYDALNDSIAYKERLESASIMKG